MSMMIHQKLLAVRWFPKEINLRKKGSDRESYDGTSALQDRV
jgi:hypothetical protein